MRHKWYELPKWGTAASELVAHPNGNGTGAAAPTRPLRQAPEIAASVEKLPLHRPVEDELENFQRELLSMDGVYRAAGILNPRRGYSITKIVEMLHSEHMRGLSKEMKRAALLMAFDAAGISVDEVLQDAKLRQETIDADEAEQRKQVEAEWARKAEENTQIQAELELIKTRYAERLRRNLDGVSREKATFANWVKLKQQESQEMAEAAELCLKPTVTADPVGSALPAVASVNVGAKPV